MARKSVPLLDIQSNEYAALSSSDKRRMRGRLSYWRHREQRLQYGNGYYKNNRDAILAKYHTNKSHRLDSRALATDDEVVEKKRQYEKNRYNRLKDTKVFKKSKKRRDKAHRDSHKDRRRIQARMRLNKKLLLVINDFTDAQWEEIKAVYQYRCVYCLDNCWRCLHKKHMLTRDHITPLFYGGGHTISNIVPACLSCNAKKGIRGVLKPVQPLLLTVA